MNALRGMQDASSEPSQDGVVDNRAHIRQDVRVGVGLRIDPRVILNSQLLQLAQTELEAAIETELAENPALERLHDETEPISDERILKTIAPEELKPRSSDHEWVRSLPPGSTEETDWLDLAPSCDSLRDHLRGQLLATLPNHLHRLAEYLLWCIDDRGYLDAGLEEAALACDASLEDAETVLARLHECDPPGIGARNLPECILLQLRGDSTLEGKLARAIVRDRFQDLVDHNVRSLMRRYRVLPEVVEAAFDKIKATQPYPGEGYAPCAGSGTRIVSHNAVPDLVITLTEAGWAIEVRGTDSQSLAVSRAYLNQRAKLSERGRDSCDERRHLTEYIDRARRFLESLDQRKLTLRRIGEYLVERQAGFVSTGRAEFLQSLTRSKMAKDLGIHESTVSRATQDKYVQIANGEVVSFDVFFNQGLRIQKLIEEILATENPNDPLSDERISRILAEKGFQVARRTVHKYRDRNKLLSSHRRRSA